VNVISKKIYCAGEKDILCWPIPVRADIQKDIYGRPAIPEGILWGCFEKREREHSFLAGDPPEEVLS
jgi:hypothetical protein